MAIPGYDPDDIEESVRERLEAGDPSALLDQTKLRAYRADADLLEALDPDTLESLVLDAEE